MARSNTETRYRVLFAENEIGVWRDPELTSSPSSLLPANRLRPQPRFLAICPFCGREGEPAVSPACMRDLACKSKECPPKASSVADRWLLP
jgi:hypothetical protein